MKLRIGLLMLFLLAGYGIANPGIQNQSSQDNRSCRQRHNTTDAIIRCLEGEIAEYRIQVAVLETKLDFCMEG